MDSSKLNRKTLSYNRLGNIAVKDLVDKDVFIDDEIKNKFLNAVFSLQDIIGYLVKFADEADEDGKRNTFLDHAFYMPRFNYTDMSDALNKNPIDTPLYEYTMFYPLYLEKITL